MEPRLAFIRYADHDYTNSDHFHLSADALALFAFVVATRTNIQLSSKHTKERARKRWPNENLLIALVSLGPRNFSAIVLVCIEEDSL